MYYFFWFAITMAASLLAIVTGVWIDRNLMKRKTTNHY